MCAVMKVRDNQSDHQSKGKDRRANFEGGTE